MVLEPLGECLRLRIRFTQARGGLNPAPIRLMRGHQAGADGLAIDQNRTGPAIACITADFDIPRAQPLAQQG